MLRVKKEREAAAAAAAAPAPAAAATGGDGTAAAADGTATASATAAAGAAATVSVMKDTGRVIGGKVVQKLKPGELRIQKDITELDAGSVGRVSWPDPAKLTFMKLSVTPDKGLWAGATFVFSIAVPDMYPHEPPKVLCETKRMQIYHPNIDLEGHVCLNILRDEWKPIYDINTVIYGLIYLFYEPNPTDPLNKEAAALMRDNYATFASNVASSLRGGRVAGTVFPRLL